MPETCVRVVKKALDALDFILLAAARDEGPGLGEVAAHMGEKAPTVRNILRTMELCGYLARDGKAYTPGPKCGDLRRGALAESVRAYLDPRMALAAEETGEGFVLVALLNGQREVLTRRQGGGAVVANLRASDGQPIYSLVTTRAMLCGADDETLARFTALHGTPTADHWPEAAGGPTAFAAALAAIRDRGHAESQGGSLHAIAVPVVLGDGSLFGALGVYIPAFRIDAARGALLLNTLRQLADEVKKRFH